MKEFRAAQGIFYLFLQYYDVKGDKCENDEVFWIGCKARWSSWPVHSIFSDARETKQKISNLIAYKMKIKLLDDSWIVDLVIQNDLTLDKF